MVYASEHRSLAMIEYFVHIDSGDPPKDLVVVTVEIPTSVSRLSISSRQLPEGWRDTPAPAALVEVGDGFVRNRRAAVLLVPSALAPEEMNCLINPGHRDFVKVRVAAIERFHYDSRFFGL